ncbi:hypothetical protein BDDG_09633, partial [Blastomyces dermatitidis ATCC 18188]
SSCVDRFMFTDNSELSVKSLIENLKNVIMKELSVSCVAESSVSLSVSSVTASQSSTPASVSGSLTLATSILMTSGFATSAFITSSPCFKEMLYRLNESCLSTKDIHVFRNENVNVILFYICEFALASEAILIEDDNITETTLSHFQASLITSSLFSAEKT